MATYNFLDKTGLGLVWAKIKALVVQSDWEETDTTDPSYIENKPAIKAGTGTNSIIEGEFEEPVTGQTMYLTGAAGALTYSFTPQLLTASTGCFIEYNGKNYKAETINIGNSTITFYSTLSSSSALSSTEVTYYNSTFKYSSGNYSHAEGSGTMATGSNSHAEGSSSLAYGGYSHAEGSACIAQGTYSHAEGRATKAQGAYSHAEGTQTRANGTATHTEGNNTVASTQAQHVQGKYNIEDTEGVYADIVGNGTAANRSNAYTLDWSGNGWFAGKVTVGTAPTNDLDVATKKYVDDHSGGSGGGSYHLAYDPNSSIDIMQTGEGTTDEPFYTPSGDILLITEEISVADGAELTSSYDGSSYVLTLGVTSTTRNITRVTGATFRGNGVRFIIEEDE